MSAGETVTVDDSVQRAVAKAHALVRRDHCHNRLPMLGLIVALEAAERARDDLGRRLEEAKRELCALCNTWSVQWDCSATPGHEGMDDAVQAAWRYLDALDAPAGEPAP